MLPRLALANIAYESIRYSELAGQFRTSQGRLPYLFNLGVGELGQFVLASSYCVLALLINAVAHVIAMSTEKQVGRIDTRRIIATVTHLHARWYRTIMQFIGDAVCQLATVTGVYHPVVTSLCLVPIACPYPTIARLVHLSPEAFGQSETRAQLTVVANHARLSITTNDAHLGARVL